MPDAAAGAVLLQDLGRVYRVADECAGIAALSDAAAGTGRGAPSRARRGAADAYAAIAAAREASLRRALARYGVPTVDGAGNVACRDAPGGDAACGDLGDDDPRAPFAASADPFVEAAAHLARAYDVLARWAEDAPAATRVARRRAVDAWRRDLAALRAFASTPVGRTGGYPGLESVRYAAVGEAGLTSADALWPVVRHAVAVRGEVPRRVLAGAAGPSEVRAWPAPARSLAVRLLSPARRFPGPSPRLSVPNAPGAGGAGGGGRRPRGGVGWSARLDRVDALLQLFAATPLPRTTPHLAAARRMLGHVLRDPAPFHALLAADPPFFGIRPALRVAAALLGAPPLEAGAGGAAAAGDRGPWGPDPVADAESYALAAVLAHAGAREPTLAFLADVSAGAPPAAARRVLDTARRQVEAGAPLSVIG